MHNKFCKQNLIKKTSAKSKNGKGMKFIYFITLQIALLRFS